MHACESAAPTKDHKGDRDKPNGEENEPVETVDHRLVVLSKLVETERAYVHDLSLVVDDIIAALKNPETVVFDVSIPDYLVGTEKDELIFNDIKQAYEWQRE